MIKFILTALLFFSNILYGKLITINEKTEQLEILSSSQIYIDNTKKLTIDTITSKNIKFQDNDKKILSYGYSPNFNVWIKMLVKNDSDKPIQKILEYGNSMTTDVFFYDNTKNVKKHDGLLNFNEERTSINPIFRLELQANQTKELYIKASSYITTMIIKLSIWESNKFYKKEFQHQAVLFLFFGAMFVMAIYNLFIYFFTRDISYLYYVFYILGISIHHTLYTGIANIYLVDQNIMYQIVQFASLFIAFPILFLALFFKTFLQIDNFPVWNKTLNILLVLYFLSIIIFLISDSFNQYRNIAAFFILTYLIIMTIYLTFKKNRQAYFMLAGWTILLLGIASMYLSSAGIVNIHQSFPYIVEVSLLLEAILFSIALSDKINTLKTKLIYQERTENERLELQVQEKTKDLNISLEEKTLLLQELNHRVKNNMQMISSLLRLQTNDIDDKKIQDIFLTTQNRLNAMSELHELLYQKEDISYINAYEYFTTLIENLQDTYTQKVDIFYTIDTDLQTEEAISCGIILNELVTNSLKHAFIKKNQKRNTINIYLSKNNNNYTLIIKDNGSGYNQKTTKKSFGLILVSTLVESKLHANLSINTQNGVETSIIWGEDDA